MASTGRVNEPHLPLVGTRGIRTQTFTVSNAAPTPVPVIDRQRTAIEIFVEVGQPDIRIGGPDVAVAGPSRGRLVTAGTGYAMNVDERVNVYAISTGAGPSDCTLVEIA